MHSDLSLIWKQSSIGKSLNKYLYRGSERYCPLCQIHYRRFLHFGVDSRKNAWCPGCGSLERHRLIWEYFEKETNLFDARDKSMLHVAPEYIYSKKLNNVESIDYLTADLNDKRAMVKMDITDIQYPDNHFDVIYCSHVLEHVQDDKKAISEFHRILKADGWAILQVPINAEKTFEDPSITKPKERERVFGQFNHVRKYGPDFKNRIQDMGFKVDLITPTDFLADSEIKEMGIMVDENIFLCSIPG